ncbi:MAG: hypothetical protein RIQ56_803 [Candidatus Parcubacteria bacterium]
MIMADDTNAGTTGGAGSNPSFSTPQNQKQPQETAAVSVNSPAAKVPDVGLPEPKILSETVIESPKITPPPPVAPPAKTPEQVNNIPFITTMPRPGKPGETIARPTFTLPAQQTGPTVSAQPTIQPRGGAALPQETDPKLAGVQTKINADIEKILKDVKLPDRNEMRATADKKIPVPSIATIVQPTLPEEVKQAAPVIDKSAVVPMHTLKDDIQNVVLEKKMSIIRAAAVEQDKHRNNDEVIQEIEAPKKRRQFGILFASILFIFLGAAAIFGVVIVESGRGTSSQTYSSSLVFAEQSLLLEIAGFSSQALKMQVAAARQTGSGSLGSITRLIPVITTNPVDTQEQKRQATTVEFFRALGVQAPDDLYRALDNTFFFGIHTVDRNVPILVLPVIAYDRAFAAMLNWEARMNADLAPVFTGVPDVVIGADGTPTRRVFHDAIMRNFDVRVLKDDSGAITLYYSFPTPNLLIIAESPYSFNEILSRLQAERRL